jgi:VWFA-related protein
LDFEEIVLDDDHRVPFNASVLRVLGGMTRQGPDLFFKEGTLVEVVSNEDSFIPFNAGVLAPWSPVAAATPVRRYLNEPVNRGGLKVARRPAPAPRPSDQRANPAEPIKLVAVVDRVVVDAVVRDKKGRVLDELQEGDFRIFEEGEELPVSEFSKALRPLALALVVDSSGSVTPFLEELQQAALETLGRVGPEDLTTLFVFSDEVGRAVDLTHSRDLISEHIGHIRPHGKTNIFDAVAYSSYYLASAAPEMQHALIIVSDNAANDIGQFGEGSAIRMAMETETVVYSLRLPSASGPSSVLRSFAEPLWLGDANLVHRITSASGGEIIELQDSGNLSEALHTIIHALKRRYCLSFTPPSRYGARFRRISVQLDDRYGEEGKDYTVSARSGYYPFRLQ